MNKTVVICLLIVSLLSTGCWNRQELNEMDFVIGAGIDAVDGEVIVVTQVIKAGILAADAPDIPAFIVHANKGMTAFEAIRNITLHSTDKLFWGHQKILVLGEEFAKEGIIEGLGFFARDHEVNRHVNVMIYREDLIELMNEHVAGMQVPMLELRSLIENYVANAKVVAMSVNEFLKTNSTPGICVVIPLFKLESVASGEKVFSMDGTALIVENVIAGELTADETRGLLWLLDRVQSAVIPLDVTDTAKQGDFLVKEVSLEVLDATTKIIANGGLKFTVQSEVDVSFGEDNFRERIAREQEEEIIAKIEKEAEKIIQKEMERVVEVTKEVGTDAAGFGRALYRQRPNEWREFENGWCTDTYPSIEVSYDITVKQVGRMMLRELDPKR